MTMTFSLGEVKYLLNLTNHQCDVLKSRTSDFKPYILSTLIPPTLKRSKPSLDSRSSAPPAAVIFSPSPLNAGCLRHEYVLGP